MFFLFEDANSVATQPPHFALLIHQRYRVVPAYHGHLHKRRRLPYIPLDRDTVLSWAATKKQT